MCGDGAGRRLLDARSVRPWARGGGEGSTSDLLAPLLLARASLARIVASGKRDENVLVVNWTALCHTLYYTLRWTFRAVRGLGATPRPVFGTMPMRRQGPLWRTPDGCLEWAHGGPAAPPACHAPSYIRTPLASSCLSISALFSAVMHRHTSVPH